MEWQHHESLDGPTTHLVLAAEPEPKVGRLYAVSEHIRSDDQADDAGRACTYSVSVIGEDEATWQRLGDSFPRPIRAISAVAAPSGQSDASPADTLPSDTVAVLLDTNPLIEPDVSVLHVWHGGSWVDLGLTPAGHGVHDVSVSRTGHIYVAGSFRREGQDFASAIHGLGLGGGSSVVHAMPPDSHWPMACRVEAWPVENDDHYLTWCYASGPLDRPGGICVGVIGGGEVWIDYIASSLWGSLHVELDERWAFIVGSFEPSDVSYNADDPNAVPWEMGRRITFVNEFGRGSNVFSTIPVTAVETVTPLDPRRIVVGGELGVYNQGGPDEFSSRLALWDGTGWQRVGPDLNNLVTASAFSHATQTLYVAGRFTEGGGRPLPSVIGLPGAI